jgi:hypothetical protein
MWTYRQSTGEIFDDPGNVIGVGYSGRTPYKNDPTAQNIKDEGPLPQGFYTIEPPELNHTVGEYAMALVPFINNTMWGRGSFYIHGDNPAHIGASSDGCVVINRSARELIWQSGDHTLNVIV